MCSAALSTQDTLTSEEEVRVSELVDSVLAAAVPQDPMLKALAQILDREQRPALAARLFESVVWRADMRDYWIYFRMACAYTALGPARDDAAFAMASLAVQMQPDMSGANEMFAVLFAISLRRGDPRAAAEIFLAAIEMLPENPPISPEHAAPVLAAAGLAVPGGEHAAPRPDSWRTHRVVEAVDRPAWTCNAIGGAMHFMLRPLTAPMPRYPIDVAELHDAELSICGDAIVVIDRDGAVHPDLSISHYPEAVRRKFGRLAASTAPPERFKVPEAVVIADDLFSGPNLCHFLLDQLTRLALYQRAGVDIGAVAVIGPEPQAAFQQRLLQRAGIAAEHVIGLPRIALVQVGRLWVSSNCCNFLHAADLGAAWAVDFARSLLGGQGQRGWRRLYISRGDLAARQVSNETEVIDLLEPLGFETIRPSEMPYDAQVAAFRQASHIVAPHGAALTHIVVCPAGASVLEIFHPLYGSPAFAQQVAESGVHYTAMLARDFQFDTPEWNDPNRAEAAGARFLARHMRVDLDVLRAYLASVL